MSLYFSHSLPVTGGLLYPVCHFIPHFSDNVVLNHQRKSTVDNHFKSDAHLRHAELHEGKKQKTLHTTLNLATLAAQSLVVVYRDWLAMLVCKYSAVKN